MRLLLTKGELSLQEFSGKGIPPYAIFSHTWGEKEVTLDDIKGGNAKDKDGYAKVKNAREAAAGDGYEYIWIDSCCIDKTSSAELSEAINSMYSWYEEAEVCYSHLADVPSKAKFADSRWFTRGWTLQELIAPSTVKFVDEKWKEIGTKSSMRQELSQITGVPVGFLLGDDLERASIAQRMSWASKRETTRDEDIAYCLMGIFGIHMPLIYGEGQRAFIRLQEEIMKASDDHSLFAWKSSDSYSGLLATSPVMFIESGNIIPTESFNTLSRPLTISNKGIHLSLPIMAIDCNGLALAILYCKEVGEIDRWLAIYVRDIRQTNEYFVREQSEKLELLNLGSSSPPQYSVRSICIEHPGRKNRKSLKGKERMTELEHQNTSTSDSNLALALRHWCKYAEAEAMERRALEGREMALGEQHPDTLTSVSNLSLVLYYQGKYAEAEAMERRALEGRTTLLGAQHRDTLTSLSNLALVLQHRGQYIEAEEMERRALKGRETILGMRNPNTLTSASNLALVLYHQGRYAEAEAMEQRALEGREIVLGAQHPDTLTSLSNLALVMWNRGKYQKAQAIYQQVLGAREKVLGHEHPDTLTSIRNLGLALYRQGKYDEAEAMYRRALEGSERVLGAEHPDTLTNTSNLELVLQHQGKYAEADAMEGEALRGRKALLGARHPDTLTSISNLALVLWHKGEHLKAKSKYQEALEGREDVLGREHPDTLTSVSDLGLVLYRQGKYNEAEALHRRALERNEKLLGAEHPETFTCTINFMWVLERLNKYEDTAAIHQRVLETREKILRRENADKFTGINNLALEKFCQAARLDELEFGMDTGEQQHAAWVDDRKFSSYTTDSVTDYQNPLTATALLGVLKGSV
jgi:tetratricopeptide (TPR) repeat protein